MPRFRLSIAAAGMVALVIVTAGAQEAPLGPIDSSSVGSDIPNAGESDSTPNASDRIGGRDSRTDPQADPARERIQTETTEGDIRVGSQRGAFLRASSFIGVPVQGIGDARLGTVGDILIDPRTYEMRYVLIDTGAGVGTNGLPIIPWTLFHTSVGAVRQGFLTVPLTMERLSQAPVTTLGANDLVWDADRISRVDSFYAADLSERRVSRPELDAESEAQSRSRLSNQEPATPGANDSPSIIRNRQRGTAAGDRRGTGGARNPTGARGGAAGRTPGSTDNAGRNRGPAVRTPGATDNRGRNRGPSPTTPGAVDNAGRGRGPATGGTPGSTDNAGRNRGPTTPGTPGAGTGAGTGSGTSGNAGSGTGTGGTSDGTGAGAGGSDPGA